MIRVIRIARIVNIISIVSIKNMEHVYQVPIWDILSGSYRVLLKAFSLLFSRFTVSPSLTVVSPYID